MWSWQSTRSRFERLQDELNELKRAVESLRALPLQWEDTLDRLTKMAGRVNARAKVVEKAESDEVPPENTNPAPPQVMGAHGRLQAMRSKRGLLPG